jgi:membrane dipeptidase
MIGVVPGVACSVVDGIPPMLWRPESSPLNISSRARDLHFRSLVIDTHADTTQRLRSGNFDLGARHSDGSVDIPRLLQGGVGAIFFAAWVPGTVTGAEAVRRGLDQIAAVHREIKLHGDHLTLAASAADILRARAAGRIAVLLAVEGGHMIGHDLDTLRRYFSLGVRYMTLTHARTIDWADASTDDSRHNGLSDFGREVVRQMNRLGMLVDVSHVSDKTFCDVLEASQAPVFASHSSCRAICGSPRNLSDEMIRALASKGGVLQINFHAGFISQEFRDAEKRNPELQREIEVCAKERFGENSAGLVETSKIVREFVAAGRLPRVDWIAIVDHIDHAVKVAGIDHVGLGSDFDGADMPYGMEDASRLPLITDALLGRGYSDADVQKILGGNMLRLLQDVEASSQRSKGVTE